MNITETELSGLYIINNDVFKDNRGLFHKPYNFDSFNKKGLDCDFKEFYYSINKKWSLRGLHFQSPPYDHIKLVYVTSGSIIDIAFDIRKESKTYGKYFMIELNNYEGKSIYIPSGFAHGFLSLEDNTIVNYAQTSCYNKDHDCGIDIESVQIQWNQQFIPLRSDRDKSFTMFKDFISPFN